MRRLTIIISLLVLLSFCGALANSASIGTWLTYRDDISIASGTCDIDATFWDNATDASGAYLNLTLPCNLENLSQTETNFTISATIGALYNLTVNGKAVNDTDTVSAGGANITTLANMVTAGVAATDEYINFTFDVNHTSNKIWMNITATAAEFCSTWLTNVITIKEKDITHLPYIGTGSTTSINVVNNSFNISNSGLWFSITNNAFNITYPSHKVTEPQTNFTVTTISDNGSAQDYVQYQKYGPYVYSVDEDVDGTTHEVTINIKGREVLSNCVWWDLDPVHNVYDEAFDDLNEDTLEVTLNSVDFTDWEWDSDDQVLKMEDFTIRAGITNNKFVFTWTEAPAPIIPPEKVWYEQIWDWLLSSIGFFPIWLIITLVVIFTAILGYAYIPSKKRKAKAKKK